MARIHLNWKMFCSAVFSSFLIIHRNGVSASSLTPNEIQYSHKPLYVVNSSSFDYTEMPQWNKRKFSKVRTGAKRRPQNRGRRWNRRCGGGRGRRGRRNTMVERDSKKAEAKCAHILEDLNESKKEGRRGIKQKLKKIRVYSKYNDCLDEIIDELERYHIDMTMFSFRGNSREFYKMGVL